MQSTLSMRARDTKCCVGYVENESPDEDDTILSEVKDEGPTPDAPAMLKLAKHGRGKEYTLTYDDNSEVTWQCPE